MVIEEDLVWIKGWQERRDPAALAGLWQRHGRLVHWAIYQIERPSADMVQAAFFAFVHALELFDPVRGAFSSYVLCWVRAFVHAERRQRFCRGLTGMSRHYYSVPLVYSGLDLEETRLLGVASTVEAWEKRRFWWEVTNTLTLTPVERTIWERRWVEPLCDEADQPSLREVGALFGVSRQRVYQIECRVLQKVRHVLASLEVPVSSSVVGWAVGTPKTPTEDAQHATCWLEPYTQNERRDDDYELTLASD